MRLHQVITGSTNTFQDQATFTCGTVDGINFTAYASGCDLVILANDFQRVQIIPGVAHGEVQITCIDCSNDGGKIAASYANQVCIFEPVPLLYQTSSHRLDYQWHETSCFTTDCFVTTLSWNREATLLLTGGEVLHVWRLLTDSEDLHSSRFGDADPAGNIPHDGSEFHSVKQQQLNAQNKLFSMVDSEQHRAADVKFSLAEDDDETDVTSDTNFPGQPPTNVTTSDVQSNVHAHITPHTSTPNVQSGWCCIWKCRTATPIAYLCFSPDATFFASAGKADRLVKVWYENTPIAVSNADFQEPYFPGNAMPSHASSVGGMRKISSSAQHHGSQHRGTYRTNYSFVYLAHPKPVTGFSWRKVSKYMPKGSVASVLLTSCQDNICRIWVETFLPDDGLINLNMDAPGMMGSTAAALSSSLLIYGNKQLRVRHRRHVLERFRHIRKSVRKLGILRLGNQGGAAQTNKPPYISGGGKNAAQKLAQNQQPATPSVVPGAKSASSGVARVPSLTRVYSSHDVHYRPAGMTTNIARGCHFHLAASIDADRDIPLVPLIGHAQTATILNEPGAAVSNSIGSPTQAHTNHMHSEQNQQFAVHWLNNKEMLFTWKAEQLLHDLSRQALNQDLLSFVRESNNNDTSTGDFSASTAFYQTDASTELESGTDTDTAEGTTEDNLKKSGKVKRKKLFRKSTANKPQQKVTTTTKRTMMSSAEDLSDHHRHVASSLPSTYMHESMSVKSTGDADTLVNYDGHSSSSGATRNGFARNSAMPVDVLDKQIEVLVRQWHQSSDLLFCVHPLDGSFLVWIIEWLDEEEAGAFRQVQVSFSSRIPQALPLADALSACARNAVYCTHSAFVDMCSMFKLANDRVLAIQHEQQAARQREMPAAGMQHSRRRKGSAISEGGNDINENEESEANNDATATVKPNPESSGTLQKHQQQSQVVRQQRYGSDLSQQNPVVSLITSHTNGSLNLWQITFLDRSNFDTIVSIKHKRRRCGHRFRVNDITSHPLLPLVLTTSHHNVPDDKKDSFAAKNPTLPGADRTMLPSRGGKSAGSFPQTDAWWLEFTLGNRFCSELILWKVENIGPLSKSSGMTELARINSPELSAFSNVAWLPTLLPSWTLGTQGGHGPSTCFVASDGHSLRIYQAVVDARSILAEHSIGSGGGGVNLPESLHRQPEQQRMLSQKTSGYGRGGMLPTLYSQFSNDSAGTQDSNAAAGEQIQPQGGGYYGHDTSRLNIVSLQSSSKPGCIIALDSIADAKHDWHNTQLLHVFPAQMIHASASDAAEKRRNPFSAAVEAISTTNFSNKLLNGGGNTNRTASPLPYSNSSLHPQQQNLEIVVDLSDQLYFEEIFYLFVLERMPHQSYSGSLLHMWCITVSSHRSSEEAAMLADGNLMSGDDGQRSPNSLIEEEDEQDDDSVNDDTKNAAKQDNDDTRSVDELSHKSMASSMKLTASARPSLRIRTTKVCRQKLPLPPGVDVVHASVAAGHLSSSSIYPACSSPYLVSTACSDGKTRFWKCRQAAAAPISLSGAKNSQRISEDAGGNLPQNFVWEEWKMMLGNDSAIAAVGQPLAVSAAYSGRIAVASRLHQPTPAEAKFAAADRKQQLASNSYDASPSHTNSVQSMSQMLSNLSVTIFECESTGGSEWLLEDTIHLHNVHITEARIKDEVDEPSRLRREKQSVENFSRIFRGHEAIMPHVASVHSLRKAIVEQGNTVFVRPKALVHLDWVSTEDGGFLLTIAVGSQIMIFAAVSHDIAQANIAAMKEAQATVRRISLPATDSGGAPTVAKPNSAVTPQMSTQQSFVGSEALQQQNEAADQFDSSSVAAFSSPSRRKHQSMLARQTSSYLAPLPIVAAAAPGVISVTSAASSNGQANTKPLNGTGETFKWLRLRVIELETADLLPPIPMNLSWVRTGLLLVGMDNEMQIFSQWRSFNAPTTTRSKHSVMTAPAATPYLVVETHNLSSERMPVSPVPISNTSSTVPVDGDGMHQRLPDEHTASSNTAHPLGRDADEFLRPDARNLSEFDLLQMQQQRTPSRMKTTGKLPSMVGFDTTSGVLNTSGRKSGGVGQSGAVRKLGQQHRGSLANIRSRSGEATLSSSTTAAVDVPVSVELMIDFGLFEAAYLASPTLPQYHPKQLTELLNFGRLNRVRAILNHVLRCIFNVAYPHHDVNLLYSADGIDADGEMTHNNRAAAKLSWSSPARRASVVASSAAAALVALKQQSSQDGGDNKAAMVLDDDALDYIEIETIPPLPLNALLDADTYRGQTTSEAEQYNALFNEHNNAAANGGLDAASDLSELDDVMGENVDGDGGSPTSTMRRSKLRKRRQSGAGGAGGNVVYNYRANLINFNAPQASVLAKMMTHIHLPGLSSLDQMHLLALSDTIANCHTGFGERAAATAAASTTADGTVSGQNTAAGTTASGPPKAEMLDECGLRFLLALKQHMFLLKCLPMAQRMRLQRHGIDSSYIAWAFHSENQEQLLESITAMHRNEMRWKDLRHIGAGWWLRNNQTLKLHIERVAKTQFQLTKEPLDAALFYVAMRKKAVVWGLYRSVGNQKMVDFFKNDFSQDRWRTAALKNAYALLGKQRFEHAAAFFLLGGAVKDAVEVCVNKLNDLQLALVILRLYESDTTGAAADLTSSFGKLLRPTENAKDEDNMGRLLRVHVLGQVFSGDADERSASTASLTKAVATAEAGAKGRFSDDPFLRSIAYWTLKDYGQSVRTLLDVKETSTGNGDESPQKSAPNAVPQQRDLAPPAVFNFYNFLRTHPVILRHNQTVYGSKTGITPKERRLFFTTAHMHLQAGCPLLAMEVLCKLPDQIISTEEQDEAKLRHHTLQTDAVGGAGTTLGGLLSESKAPLSNGDDADRADDSISNRENDDADFMPLEKPKEPVVPPPPPATTNDSAGLFDWSMPAYKPKEETLDLTFDDDEEADKDADEDGLAEKPKADDNGLNFSSSSSKKQPGLVNGDVKDEYADNTDKTATSGMKSKLVNVDQLNNSSPAKAAQKSTTPAKTVDIMAQQLKFIAGLKILMEELRTLSSGYDVEGGQLRYHLYLWLEKEVDLLKRLCDTHGEVDLASVKHASDAACAGAAVAAGGGSGGAASHVNLVNNNNNNVDPASTNQGPSLHEIILADKLDFDARLALAKRRKYWLKNHQQLLRSFINYCSLYGATGGGLTSVHMELTLLMQELHQGTLQQQKQLQSPLPFPTTLPLVSAYVAAQKPLQGDPVQLLTTLSTDVLSSLSAIQCAPKYGDDLSTIFTMRDIAVALSSCVYESLCDADTLMSHSAAAVVQRIARRKSGDAGGSATPPPPIGLEAFSIAAATSQCSGGSQLMMAARSQHAPRTQSGGSTGGVTRGESMRARSGATAASLLAAAMHESSDTSTTMPTTQPSKWPGVQSLRALIAREKDDDAPKLHILLLEIYAAVYMALVFYALATYDCNLLYRLVGHTFNVRTWSELFGGGAKKSVRVRRPSNPSITADSANALAHSLGRTAEGTANQTADGGADQWNKQRFWMHMKLLGQNKAGPLSSNAMKSAAVAEASGASSTTSREVFIPPKMSIVHCLMLKPKMPETNAASGRPRLISYDSSASLPADLDEDEGETTTVVDAVGNTDLADETTPSGAAKPTHAVKKAEHTDPYSYAWNILRLAVLKVAHKHIVSALNVLSLDLQDVPVVSPLLYSVLLKLDQWERVQSQLLDDFVAAPVDFIPEQAQPSVFNLKIGAAITSAAGGPAIQRYRAMLEPQNTPFYKSNTANALPAKRLWNYLIQQDALQETFIRYIYRKATSHRNTWIAGDDAAPTPVPPDAGAARPHTSSELYSNLQSSSRSAQSSAVLAEMDRTAHAVTAAVQQLQYVMPAEPVKVIQKDQEPIASFCWNNANPHWIAVSAAREICELDIGLLLSPPSWLEDELEYDIANLRSNFNDSPDPDFVVLRTPYDRTAGGGGGTLSDHNSSMATPTPSTNTAAAVALANSNTMYGGGGVGGFGVGVGTFGTIGVGPTEPATLASGRSSTLNMKGLNEPALANHKYLLYVMERSMHMMKKLISRPVRDVRRLAAHPALPYYLSGSQDGSVRLWEFNHSPPLSTLCQSTSLARINWLAFNAQGNKFGATDADGVVRLWQLSNATTNAVPYRALKCHTKTCSAFSFVSSSSVLATCGFSSENRNVAVWDTLAPAAQAQVAAFVCHDQGSPCMTYASQHQLLITGGKKGDVCIFDIRQRQLMHKFQAHDASSGAIRTIALDPSQEYFVTGAADGDIKLWTLGVHSCIATLTGEHAKSGLFSRNITGGVSQVAVDGNMRLFSCGADGYFKLRNLTGIDAHILRIMSEKQQH